MEKILYNAMLSRIQKEIREHKEELDKIKQIDLEHCKIGVEIDKFLEIIETYKEMKTSKKEKNLIVYCNGNPYVVLNLAMISILNNINMNIEIDNIMVGINKYILEIINNVIRENSFDAKIKIVKTLKDEDNIICIDRINEYNILKKKHKKIKYIPYQSIDIYSDCEEFEELFEKIYNYSLDMNIDIDIFDEEGIDGLFKYGKGKNKLILSRNRDIVEKYRNENVYLNENPFKKEKVIFDRDIINAIIQ